MKSFDVRHDTRHYTASQRITDPMKINFFSMISLSNDSKFNDEERNELSYMLTPFTYQKLCKTFFYVDITTRQTVSKALLKSINEQNNFFSEFSQFLFMHAIQKYDPKLNSMHGNQPHFLQGQCEHQKSH